MKGKINISKQTGVAYIPVGIIKEGYHGPVATLANSCTITLLKPDTPLEEIKSSLEVVLLDIELRLNQEKRENNKG